MQLDESAGELDEEEEPEPPEALVEVSDVEPDEELDEESVLLPSELTVSPGGTLFWIFAIEFRRKLEEARPRSEASSFASRA